MKCCCKNCAFGGGFKPKDKLAECNCKDNPDRITRYCNLWGKDKEYVERNEWEEEVYCPHFLANIEPKGKEYVSYLNITSECPYCGTETYDDDVDMEGEMIVTCEECGKEFRVHWCEY